MLGHRLGPVVAVAVVAVVTAAGCGGGGGGGDDEVGGAGTTPTTVDEESAVLDAYRASWEAFVDASAQPANPDHPALAETMTGEALQDAQESLRQMAESGEYLEGPGPDLVPELADLAESRATVEDCVVEEGVRYGPGGEELARSAGNPYRVRVEMVKEADGVWRQATYEGGDPCER